DRRSADVTAVKRIALRISKRQVLHLPTRTFSLSRPHRANNGRNRGIELSNAAGGCAEAMNAGNPPGDAGTAVIGPRLQIARCTFPHL
ncbi:hypothetical protein ACTGV4_11725, partial [Streptococcus suis]